MLEITKKTLTLEPQEVMELERIITDEDREGAFQFLKKYIYQQFTHSQENRLKSHLDGCSDPAGSFSQGQAIKK
jgi:hypothetical protein